MILLIGLHLSLATSRRATAQAAPAPIVYQDVVNYNKALADAEQALEKQRQKEKEQEEQDRQQRQQQMQQLQQMMSGFGGQKGAQGRQKQANGGDAAATAADSTQNTSTGTLEPCGTVPATVQRDMQEMMSFRKSCAAADKGSTQRFAVNEYRTSLGTPTMYLFDSSGECKYKTAVAYGSGQTRGTTDSPRACAAKDGHYTPAGMHLTVPHPKGSNGYDESNSLGMAGLEGQGSNARGILIHGSNSPGMGYSYGCSGVDKSCISSVMTFLGYGALVFNSFDDSQSASNCANTAGMKRSGTCQAEVAVSASAASPASPASSSGSGGAAR